MTQKKQQNQKPSFIMRSQNIFFCNGITSLLGWNAVLGSLDYFNHVYVDYNVFLYFPVPVFIAYATTAVLFHTISLKFGFKSLTKFGIIGVNLTMLVLFLFSIFFKQSIQIGFWLSLIILFFLGCFNNFCQLSFFGMINYFGMNIVSRFTIGTAASGLSLMLIRVIVTLIFGADHQNIAPIAIYFSLAIIFNFFDFYLNLRLFNSAQYIEKIQKVQSAITEDLNDRQDNKKLQNQSFKAYILILVQSFKATHPYPLIIGFTFVITFLLFPNLTLAKQTSLGNIWTSIIMLLVYNIGDFSGKLLGDFRGSFNARSTLYLFFSRLFFFFTIPLMDKQFTQDDYLLNNNIFPFFNQLLFSLTNGLVINASFILAFQKAPVEYKKYAGVLCGILLQFGITLGTFLAIPFDQLVKPDLQ